MLVIDAETTGTDRQRDQIVELCILEVGGEPRSRRFRPTIGIPSDATAIHGITEADVAECPPFAACAKSVRAHLDAAPVIAGYNLQFDLEMIQAELARAGLEPLDLTPKLLIDAMRLWQHFEPRTLAAAHAKFVGQQIPNAHSAAGDVKATAAVLEAMREKLCAGASLEQLAELSDPMPGRKDWVGPSGHLRWAGDLVVFGIGKHEGAALTRVPVDYLQWVQRADFPQHVKNICAEAAQINVTDEQLVTWVRERYPRKETR